MFQVLTILLANISCQSLLSTPDTPTCFRIPRILLTLVPYLQQASLLSPIHPSLCGQSELLKILGLFFPPFWNSSDVLHHLQHKMITSLLLKVLQGLASPTLSSLKHFSLVVLHSRNIGLFVISEIYLCNFALSLVFILAFIKFRNVFTDVMT